MRTSAIHEAISAVVELLRAVPDLDRVSVVDGPPFEWNPLRVPNLTGDGRRFIFIGADPDGDDGESAAAVQNWAGTGLPRDKDENFTISCVGLVLDGGENVGQYRGECFAMISEVETVLLEHIDLSADSLTPGPVLYSGFAGVRNLKQFYTDQGTTISAQFDIACRAYLTS